MSGWQHFQQMADIGVQGQSRRLFMHRKGAVHFFGASHNMSRNQSTKRGQGSAVVDVAEAAGLAKKVARLEPLLCIKG